jgi:hypothetical protein
MPQPTPRSQPVAGTRRDNVQDQVRVLAGIGNARVAGTLNAGERQVFRGIDKLSLVRTADFFMLTLTSNTPKEVPTAID